MATLRGFQTRIDGIRKEATTLDSGASPLLEAVNARSFWPQLLEDLNARLPKENIWVTELIPLSNGKPVIGAVTARPGAAAPRSRTGGSLPVRGRVPLGDARKAGPRLTHCLFGDCNCGTPGNRKWWSIISKTWWAHIFSRLTPRISSWRSSPPCRTTMSGHFPTSFSLT